MLTVLSDILSVHSPVPFASLKWRDCSINPQSDYLELLCLKLIVIFLHGKVLSPIPA